MKYKAYKPGALTTEDAEEYVGGKTILAALIEAWPETVQPVYQSTRLKAYRTEDLDCALAKQRLEDKPLGPVKK